MRFMSDTNGKESELRSLWERCFPEDGAAYLDYVFEKKYDPRQCFALVDDDGWLTCALHLLQLEVTIRGKSIKLPFIYGAATFPEYRKKGLMKSLLQFSFEELRKRGFCAVALYPFNYGFYRKTGFGVMEECAVCEYDSEWLMSIVPETDVFAPNPNEMKQSFDHMMKRFDTRPERDEKRHADRLAEWTGDGGSAMACGGGYALYAPQNGIVEVEEFVYSDESAMRTLLYALGTVCEPADCGSVKLILPVDEVPHSLFADDRGAACIEPHAMLNIFDIERFFTGMSAYPDAHFSVEIIGGLTESATGVFEFASVGGELTVRRTDKADARMTADAIAELAAGRVDIRTAAAIGLIKGNEQTLTEAAKVFTKQKGFFFEKY